MEELQVQDGIVKQKTIKVVPICDGAAHLQNNIISNLCYICGKPADDSTALLRIRNKELGYVCLDHPGVVAEFIRQFKRVPLGWVHTISGDKNALGTPVGQKKD